MKEILKNKVSGILRVKNDGMFIERCVKSCIDALDELVIVHNDCSDNSVDEIERMRAKYPDKIRCFEYPYKVLGVGLSRTEYELAKSLPENSPNLLCSYYNFALSKVTSQYALKIDADQIYFTDTLKQWCDFVRECKPMKFSIKVLVGILFDRYLMLYRYMSIRMKRVLPLIPSWILSLFYPAYLEYARYAFSHDKACLALSGVNVLEDDSLMIPMGHKVGNFVSGIPFNGEGDHVLFRVTKHTFFSRMHDYSEGKSNVLSIIEELEHPYKMMFVGFFWKHIRAMRPVSLSNARSLLKIDPTSYITIDDFGSLSYKEIMLNSSPDVFRLFPKILFGFIYKANKKKLFQDLNKNEE